MFKIRTSAPKQWLKIYNNGSNGGISWCISGKVRSTGKPDPTSNVLANCVGYACSRFNEIYNELTGYDGMKYKELCCNAENFYDVAKQIGLECGQTPQAGAIMCWEGIGSLAGHVAIVEKVNSDTQVYTSESGYNSSVFWNANRAKGTGNWGESSSYRFRGFIYNPAVKQKEEESVFNDIKTTDEHYKQYKAIYELGIMKTDSKGNFNPKKKVTRGALAVILYRVLKKTNVIK